MTLDQLHKKLRKVEALLAGAKTEGERQAAITARNHLRQKLSAYNGNDSSPKGPFADPYFIWNDLMTQVHRGVTEEVHRKATAAAAAPRKRGRPKGSRNKSKETLQEVIQREVQVTLQGILRDIFEKFPK